MANQEHLDILAKGVAVWNAWRTENESVIPNLVGVNLGDAILTGANLGRAVLMGTIFSDANLRHANLTRAILMGAILTGANLGDANLTRAILMGAILSDANLSHANLGDAILTQASLWRTVFADVDLSTVNGLDTVRHLGPSTIGIDTIYKSQGKIPESFLRGAGVPESFITCMRSIRGAARDF